MTRINRPDTLFTELRELRRRLRLLEATTTSAPLARMRAPSLAVPLVPARSADWPATTSPEWERLLMITTSIGSAGARLAIEAAAAEGTTGSLRVSVNGTVVGTVFPVTAEVARLDVVIDPVDEGGIVVEARRTGGDGDVRAVAWLVR